MMRGSSMVKVRSSSWQKSRSLRLLDDGLTVWCESTKSSFKGKSQQTCEFGCKEVLLCCCVCLHWSELSDAGMSQTFKDSTGTEVQVLTLAALWWEIRLCFTLKGLLVPLRCRGSASAYNAAKSIFKPKRNQTKLPLPF